MSNQDFSFLSEEERDHILSVLQREEDVQKELDVQVKETAKRLQTIQKAARSANGCTCCGTEFGMIFNRGALCPKCNSKVCKSCREKEGPTWECSKCSLKRELQLETGTWFYRQGSSGEDVSPSRATASAGPLPTVCKNLKQALTLQSSVATAHSIDVDKLAVKGHNAMEKNEELPSAEPDRHSLTDVDPTPLHAVPGGKTAITGSAAICVVYRGGKVVVGVRELKDLCNPRSSGLPNPYYRLYLLPDDEHASKRVSPSMRGTVWPAFNSQFEFEVPFDDVFDNTLWLSVWDHTVSGHDQFMGEVRLELSRLDLRTNDLLHYTLQDRSIDCEPPAERSAKLERCSSHESLFSVGSSQSAVSKFSLGSSSSVQIRGFLKMSIVHRSGELQVYVDSAINLANPHHLGNPDPYVKAYLLPDRMKLTKRKTKAARQTIDPKYRSSLTWAMPLDHVHSKMLHMAVYDSTRLSRNSFLGEVRLRLDTVDLEDATCLEYALCPRDSKVLSDINLAGDSLAAAGGHSAAAPPQHKTVVAARRGKGLSPLTRSDSVGSFESVSSTITTAAGGMTNVRRVVVTGFITFGVTYSQGKLQIDVRRCIDLAAPRGAGTVADPYVKLYLLPDKHKATKRKTKAKKKTLDPVFSETLSIKVAENDLKDRVLWLSVWDNHALSRNTFLGEVRLTMSTVTFVDESMREMPLFDLHSPEVGFNDMAMPAMGPAPRVIHDPHLMQDDPAAAADAAAAASSDQHTPPVSVAVIPSASPEKGSHNTLRAADSLGFSSPQLGGARSKPKDLDATSMYSVGSVATMAPGAVGKSVAVTGTMTLALYYTNGYLHCKVKGCTGLASPHSNGLVDPYVKTYILPDKSKSSKKKTKAAKKTTSPKFSEDLQYKMTRGELSGHTLWVSVWDNTRLGHNTFLGEVRLLLDNVDLLHQQADTYDLQEKDSLPCNMAIDDDDLMPPCSSEEPPSEAIEEQHSSHSVKAAASGEKSDNVPAECEERRESQGSNAAGVAKTPSSRSIKSLKAGKHLPTDQPEVVVSSVPVQQRDAMLEDDRKPLEPRVGALKRHDSMGSLKSTASAFGNAASVAEVTGSITLSMCYVKKKFEVHIVGCDGLSTPPKSTTADPYAKMYLLPDAKKQTKKKTKAMANNLNPQFDETLSYKLAEKELTNRILWLSVWDNARLAHNTFLGEVRLDLTNVDFSEKRTKTFNLQEKSSDPVGLYRLEQEAKAAALMSMQEVETRERLDEDQHEEEKAEAEQQQLEAEQRQREADAYDLQEKDSLPCNKPIDDDDLMPPCSSEEPPSEAIKEQHSSQRQESQGSNAAGVAKTPSGRSIKSLKAGEHLPADQPEVVVNSVPVQQRDPMLEDDRKPLEPRVGALKRHDSIGSLKSTASAFGNAASVAEVTGSITLSMCYVKKKFEVHIVGCDGLSTPPKSTTADPYVKMYLLPDAKKQTKKKTKAMAKNLNPQFAETLSYKLAEKELTNRILWLSVWDNARLAHNTFLGEVRLDLTNVDFSEKHTKTFNLQEKSSDPVGLYRLEQEAKAAALMSMQEVETRERLDEDQHEEEKAEAEQQQLEAEQRQREDDAYDLQEKDSLPCNTAIDDDDLMPPCSSEEPPSEAIKEQHSSHSVKAAASGEKSDSVPAECEERRESQGSNAAGVAKTPSGRSIKSLKAGEHLPADQPEVVVNSVPVQQRDPMLEDDRKPLEPRIGALKRHDSMGSLKSTASAFGNAASVAEVTGSITLSMCYVKKKFEVHIVGCDGLSTPPKSTTADPYVKMYLLPDAKKQTKKKTKAMAKNLNPQFDETLSYKLAEKELTNRILWLSVWDNARLAHNTFLGEVRLDLTNVDFSEKHTKTFNLQEKSSDPVGLYRLEQEAKAAALMSMQEVETRERLDEDQHEEEKAEAEQQQLEAEQRQGEDDAYDLQEKDSLPCNTAIDDDDLMPPCSSEEPPSEAIKEQHSSHSVKAAASGEKSDSVPAECEERRESQGSNAAGVAKTPSGRSIKSLKAGEHLPADQPEVVVNSVPVQQRDPMLEDDRKPLEPRVGALKRHDSMGSLKSTASAFGNAASVAEVTGSITLSMCYVKKKFEVHIVGCDGLSTPPKSTTADPYVKMYLLPDAKKQTKKKTKAMAMNLNPQFAETLSYKLAEKELTNRILWLSVWDNARLAHNTFLGEVRLDLTNVDFSEKHTKTFNLQEKSSDPVGLYRLEQEAKAAALMSMQEAETRERLDEDQHEEEKAETEQQQLEAEQRQREADDKEQRQRRAEAEEAQQRQREAKEEQQQEEAQAAERQAAERQAAERQAAERQAEVTAAAAAAAAAAAESAIAQAKQQQQQQQEEAQAAERQAEVNAATAAESAIAQAKRHQQQQEEEEEEERKRLQREEDLIKQQAADEAKQREEAEAQRKREEEALRKQREEEEEEEQKRKQQQQQAAAAVEEAERQRKLEAEQKKIEIPDVSVVAALSSDSVGPKVPLDSRDSISAVNPAGLGKGRTSSMKRSGSISSINSSASAFVGAASVVEVTGSITLSLRCSKKKFEVHIGSCEGLSTPPKSSTADPYVKTYLLPDPKKQSKKKTKAVSKNLSPQFAETLTYKVAEKELNNRILWVSVWDNARLAHNTFLGEIRLDLTGTDLSEKLTKTLHLMEKNSDPVTLHQLDSEAKTATLHAMAEEERQRRLVEEAEEEQRHEKERREAEIQRQKAEEDEWMRMEEDRQKDLEEEQQRELEAAEKERLQKEAAELEAQRQLDEKRRQEEEEEERQQQQQRLREQEAQRKAKEAEEQRLREEEEKRKQEEAEEQREQLRAAELKTQQQDAANEKKQAEAAELQRQEEADRKKQEEEAAEHKKQLDMAEAAEQKRQLDMAQEKEQAEAAEQKRQQEEADRKKAEDAAELKRQEEAAQKKKEEEEAAAGLKKREEEAERKRQEEEEEEEEEAAEQQKLEEAAEQKKLEEAAEQKKLEEAAEQKKLEEAAEQKKLEEAAEQKKLEEAAEQKKLEEAAEQKKLLEAAEQRKGEEAAEQRKREEAAEQKKLEEAAEQKKLEEAAEQKKLEEAAEQKKLEEAAEQKKLEEAAEQKKREEAAEQKKLEEAAEQKKQQEEEERQQEEEEKAKGTKTPPPAEHDTLASASVVLPSVAVVQSSPKKPVKEREALASRDSASSRPGGIGLFGRRDSISSLGSQQSAVSTYSVMTGKRVDVTGSMTVGISCKGGKLNLEIVGCKDLASPHSSGQVTAYVKAYLLPDKSKDTKKKTKSLQKSRNPMFKETISYKMDQKSCENVTAQLSVWDKSRVGHNTFLGEVRIPLYSVDLTDPTPAEYVLREPEAVEEEGSAVGEMVVSLRTVAPDASGKKKSKSPKITVEVLIESACNLPVKSKSGFIDPFVKCYLLPDTKNKQKTPTLTRNNSPIWKHTLGFEGALAAVTELESRSLELTVWDFDKRGSNDFLGGLLLGLGDKSGADEAQHWRELMAAPAGQWVEKRHFLQMSQRR